MNDAPISEIFPPEIGYIAKGSVDKTHDHPAMLCFRDIALPPSPVELRPFLIRTSASASTRQKKGLKMLDLILRVDQVLHALTGSSGVGK